MQSIFLNTCFRTFRFSYFKHFHSISRKSVLKLTTANLQCAGQHRSNFDFKHNSLHQNNDISQTFVNFKIIRLIKGAIRESGPILKENKKLEAVLKKADEFNVPLDFINFALRMAVDTRAKGGIYEMLYLNHGYLIIQYEDIDNYSIKHHLLQICDKYDAHLISGKVKWDTYFNPKGIISIKDSPSQPLRDAKIAENISNKIGSEFVKKELDIEGWISWRFYCEPGDLHKIKRLLQEENYEIEEAYVGLVPKRKIPLPGPAKQATHSIICKISEIPTVDNVYTNIML